MSDTEYKAWRARFYARGESGYSLRPQFVHNPSSLFVMGDNTNKETRTAWYWAGFSIYNNIAYAVHNGRVNILWFDGHADSNGQGDLSRKLHASRKALVDFASGEIDF